MSGPKALFSGADANGRFELWSTDGTDAGTSLLAVPGTDLSFGLRPSGLGVYNGKILFGGADGDGAIGLWTSDGTAAGTVEIAVAGAPVGGLFPGGFTALGGVTLFGGLGTGASNQLWKTDGTSAGTQEIVVAGLKSVSVTSVTNLPVVLGGKMLFNGNDAANRSGLWITDGSAAGTSMLVGNGLSPQYLVSLGSKVLFVGHADVGGASLWSSDGTPGGTVKIDVSGGSFAFGLAPTQLAVLGNLVMFNASNVDNINGIWVSDGTALGTKELVVAGASDIFGLNPVGFALLGGNRLVFNGTNAAGHPTLWISDGTAAGTVELAVTGAAVNFVPTGMTSFGDSVIFSGRDQFNQVGLWTTDGTSAGTKEVNIGVLTGAGLQPKNFATTVACFVQGTRIRTTKGEVAVEQLAVGDRVLTVSGASRPIVWLGRRRFDCMRHPQPRKVLPVRIAAAAFGPGQPGRDLLLSPDHAIYAAPDDPEEAFIVPVKCLVNGLQVAQVPAREVTYWHVELDAHDVVFAEGLPVESYLDTGNRDSFEAGEALRLHPDFAPCGGFTDLYRESLSYAPMLVAGPRVDRLRERLRGGLDTLRADAA